MSDLEKKKNKPKRNTKCNYDELEQKYEDLLKSYIYIKAEYEQLQDKISRERLERLNFSFGMNRLG